MGPIGPIPAGKHDAPDDRAGHRLSRPVSRWRQKSWTTTRDQEPIARFVARQHWEKSSTGLAAVQPAALAQPVDRGRDHLCVSGHAARVGFGSPIRPWMMFLACLAAYGAYRLVRFVSLPCPRSCISQCAFAWQYR